jgi:hypothetical protein
VQRRVDALSALGRGAATLVCGCGSEDCPAANTDADPGAGAGQVVMHVLAEQPTVSGEGTKPGYVMGYGPVPADVVSHAAKNAKLKPLVIPKAKDAKTDSEAKSDPAPKPNPAPKAECAARPDSDSQLGYRPTAALRDFVIGRDLTCRWPNCDVEAARCDVDHTVPYPQGPTHPSNNKLYCRHHHLMKTFWTGPGGFTDGQHPDGTITIVSPTGRRFSSSPFGAEFFPQLGTSTGDVQTCGRPPPSNDGARTLKMPRRARTRAAARTARVAHERARRRAHVEANPPPF